MPREANFVIVESSPTRLVIRDLGPWDQFLSVTNAAEDVVERLARCGALKPGMRLFYYDSEGELTEILFHWNPLALKYEFGGFAPVLSEVDPT